MVYRFSIFRPEQDSLEAFGSGCLLCVSESQFVSGIFKKVIFREKDGARFCLSLPHLRSSATAPLRRVNRQWAALFPASAATPSHRAGVTHSTAVITFN
jgi:hypothetical protein